MNPPSGYAVITVTDTTQTPQSIYAILTTSTVPTGYSRSTEAYALPASPTVNPVESNLTAGVRELSWQAQGPGSILVGADSKITTSHYRAKFGAGDSDRWRSTQNDISLRNHFVTADTNNAVVAIGWDKA